MKTITMVTMGNVRAQVTSLFLLKNKLVRQRVLLFSEKDNVDLMIVEEVSYLLRSNKDVHCCFLF